MNIARLILILVGLVLGLGLMVQLIDVVLNSVFLVGLFVVSLSGWFVGLVGWIVGECVG